MNREFEVLYEFMEKLPDALKPGGRVAILTFHSGEDKLVKKALKEGCRAGIYADYSKDVVRPSAQECAQNGRARSTKMRWQSGHRRFIGADMVSWIEIKNECSDHVNYKLAWLKKKKLDVFMHPVFLILHNIRIRKEIDTE